MKKSLRKFVFNLMEKEKSDAEIENEVLKNFNLYDYKCLLTTTENYKYEFKRTKWNRQSYNFIRFKRTKIKMNCINCGKTIFYDKDSDEAKGIFNVFCSGDCEDEY